MSTRPSAALVLAYNSNGDGGGVGSGSSNRLEFILDADAGYDAPAVNADSRNYANRNRERSNSAADRRRSHVKKRNRDRSRSRSPLVPLYAHRPPPSRERDPKPGEDGNNQARSRSRAVPRRTPSPDARGSGTGDDLDGSSSIRDFVLEGPGEMVGGRRPERADASEYKRWSGGGGDNGGGGGGGGGGSGGAWRRGGWGGGGSDAEGKSAMASNYQTGPLSSLWAILDPDSPLRKQQCVRCLIGGKGGTDLAKDIIHMDSIIPNNYHQEALPVLVKRISDFYAARIQPRLLKSVVPELESDAPEWSEDMIRLHYLDHSVPPATNRAIVMRSYMTMLQRINNELLEVDTVTKKKHVDVKMVKAYVLVEERLSALSRAASISTSGGGGGGGYRL